MLHADRTSHVYPSSPKDFPTPIRDALSRLAGRVGTCAEIKPRARMLLAELVRCIDYKAPKEPIRVRNDTLSLAMGSSERSVGRIKQELELEGWIGRRQVKSRRRGMQVSDAWLTERALAALGLVADTPVDKSPRLYPQHQRMRKPAAADAFQTLPQSSSKRQSTPVGTPVDENTPAQKTGCSERQSGGKQLSAAEMVILRQMQDQYGENLEGLDSNAEAIELDGTPLPTVAKVASTEGVPEDLMLLAAAGLTLSAIRKLMGLASKAGTRLGDVVAVAGRHILKARKAYSYVLKLLKSGKDWSALARIPGEEGLANKWCDKPWELTPDEAGHLGLPAHELLAHDMSAVSIDGTVLSIQKGLICETNLSRVEAGDWGAPAAHLGTADGYERMARGIVARQSRGELKLATRADVVRYAAEEASVGGKFRIAVMPGTVLVDQGQGLAWRFGMQGLEQAELRVVSYRNGARTLPWAQQRHPGFEQRLAKLWRSGSAVVVDEQISLEIAAACRAIMAPTPNVSAASRLASGSIAEFLPSLQTA